MFGMSHSRGLSSLLSFETNLPFDRLPSWKDLRSKPLAEQKALLRDPELRKRLVHAAHNETYPVGIGAEPRKPNFNELRVLDKILPPNPTVAELAAKHGKDPVELMIDMALEKDLELFFLQPLAAADEKEQLAMMKYPRTAMTFSDSGAHVSQILDSSIQTHLLAYWVREKQAFTLEEAVRMITLAPAQGWGMHDRGLIRVGMAADFNVFDPATVAPNMPTVATDLPGGSKRLKQTAQGFLATIVGGEIVLSKGNPTGKLPGKLLRGPLHTRH
jgi:N-acyl-D-aspartate/D-glutamate deacylase